MKQVGRELGVRYVLEGSVRRGSGRVRVIAQLIDVETGNHVWAERYDRALDDVFAVQDEITMAVVAAIAGVAVAVQLKAAAMSRYPLRMRNDLDPARRSAIDDQITSDRPEAHIDVRSYQIARTWPSAGRAREQFNRSEEAVAEALRSCGVSHGDIVDNLKQIRSGRR